MNNFLHLLLMPAGYTIVHKCLRSSLQEDYISPPPPTVNSGVAMALALTI